MPRFGLRGARAGGLPGCGERSGWDTARHRDPALTRCSASANRAGLLAAKLVMLTLGGLYPCDTPFITRLLQTNKLFA